MATAMEPVELPSFAERARQQEVRRAQVLAQRQAERDAKRQAKARKLKKKRQNKAGKSNT